MKRRLPLCEFSMALDQGAHTIVTPLLKRIYENRNIKTVSDVIYSLDQLYPPYLLKDIHIASVMLYRAVQQDQLIMIVGDYDTDGATATTLGLLCLQEMGADHLKYLVPNRFEYGYGLSKKVAALALKSSPDLLITVDNGISSIEGVELLKDSGVEVIVTDHHLPRDDLPRADAIINPSQPECQFPSKNLAGVGVIFYLLLAVRTLLREEGWFTQRGIPIPNLARYLDLVALGTMADMVPLDKNNRILVAQGIARIRSGKCQPGIAALLETAGKKCDKAIASDLGFFVAPRLNAAGRLEDISTGIECLLTATVSIAKNYAAILNEMNSERRRIESIIQDQALSIIRNLKTALEESDDGNIQAGICLFHSSWHQGVTGLVASRIKEKTEQPVIIFARNNEGMLTGSVRSIPGLHICDLLENIAKKHPGLITKFGGHALAAGLTIRYKDLQVFKEIYHTAVETHFSQYGYEGLSMLSDGELSAADITLECAEILRNASPWGQGFPAPMFDGFFNVINHRVVGGQHIKFHLQSDEGAKYDAIAFRAITTGEKLFNVHRIHTIYQMDINEFRGHRCLQLILEKFEIVAR